jgi:hypothetical protein
VVGDDHRGGTHVERPARIVARAARLTTIGPPRGEDQPKSSHVTDNDFSSA